jgi:hypothetical protein
VPDFHVCDGGLPSGSLKTAYSKQQKKTQCKHKPGTVCADPLQCLPFAHRFLCFELSPQTPRLFCAFAPCRKRCKQKVVFHLIKKELLCGEYLPQFI